MSLRSHTTRMFYVCTLFTNDGSIVCLAKAKLLNWFKLMKIFALVFWHALYSFMCLVSRKHRYGKNPAVPVPGTSWVRILPGYRCMRTRFWPQKIKIKNSGIKLSQNGCLVIVKDWVFRLLTFRHGGWNQRRGRSTQRRRWARLPSLISDSPLWFFFFFLCFS
jgi:hypothetical protein